MASLDLFLNALVAGILLGGFYAAVSLGISMAFGLLVYEIDLVLSRRFLSQAGEGANSFFYYAQRLCDVPQGIFALAIATAALPALADLAASGTPRELALTAARARTPSKST
jgi:putative peptidoglycan lipid II flippase